MKTVKKYKIDNIKDKFHLTLKDGHRTINLGVYDTLDAANEALLEAKTDFNSFVSKLSGVGSGRSNTGKNYSKTKYGKYIAYIYYDSKKIHLGSWKTEEQAKNIIELAKNNLEEALKLVSKNADEYYMSKSGNNYYKTEYNSYEVAIKRHMGGAKNIKWYFLGSYKTEEQAKCIVDEFKKYEQEHDTLDGVEEYIKKIAKDVRKNYNPVVVKKYDDENNENEINATESNEDYAKKLLSNNN